LRPTLFISREGQANGNVCGFPTNPVESTEQIKSWMSATLT